MRGDRMVVGLSIQPLRWSLTEQYMTWGSFKMSDLYDDTKPNKTDAGNRSHDISRGIDAFC